MREILFRAKTTRESDKGKWFYGVPTFDEAGNCAMVGFAKQLGMYNGEMAWMNGCIDVFPNTVGQYIGLRDRNGIRIFENDIVKWNDGTEEQPVWRFAVVKLNPDIQFDCLPIGEIDGVKNSSRYTFRYGNFAYKDTEKHLIVIGNIHDNPAWLNGKSEKA